MLTPKQTSIFGTFLTRPYKEWTYKELKTASRETSNSVLQSAIIAFQKEDLLTKREVGNSILYKPNLDNTATLAYFQLCTRARLPKTVTASLNIIKHEIAESAFFSLVIFGSFANSTQTPKSDLDIAIFVVSTAEKRTAELALKAAAMKSLLPLDTHVFTKSEMLTMLKDKEENLGKQIAKKHLAIINPSTFYTIINEGVGNGFVPETS